MPPLGKCLQMAKYNNSDLQLFVDLMVAHDFRDAQQQAYISWVHLAKIFAFVLKEDDIFMEAAAKDLDEKFVHTLVNTNVWKYFHSEENANYFAYVGKIHSQGVQDNQFITYNDQPRTQKGPQSTWDGGEGNPDITSEEKSAPNEATLLVTQRRVVHYVCRASIKNQGIQFLQTVVILQALFGIWPALESHLPTLFSEYIGANKEKKNPQEMEAGPKQIKTKRIYVALLRTWHGNLLKFPTLIYLKTTLAKWRNEEKAKSTAIESFSSQHSYHMERLRDDISAWYIYENNIWPFVWKASYLKEGHRETIRRLVNAQPVSTITDESEEYRKKKRIQSMMKDKLYTVQKLKDMCSSTNAPYRTKDSRQSLIEAFLDKEHATKNANKGKQSPRLACFPYLCILLVSLDAFGI